MKKIDTDTFIKRAREVHGDKYDYSKVVYINSGTKVCIICPEHGEFWQVPNSHLKGNGCPECAGLKKWNTEKFIKIARDVHGDKYDYSKTKYVNKRTNVIITCPIHGDFSQNPHNHAYQKQGCPLCGKKYAAEWRKNGYESFIEESKKRFGDIYEFPNIETEYINSHSKIHLKCKKCGQVFEKIACDHLTSQYGGCRKCYVQRSHGEEEIGNFIEKLIGKENVVFRNRSILNGQELDIFIPSLKIGIEYNGIYWHNIDNKPNKNFHLQKTELCENKGIRLIQIFEDEYENQKEITLSKISHLLGKSSSEKIMGRKCTISVIERKKAKHFLEKNHIQGFVNSSVYLGAIYNGDIIGVMTFIKRKNEWELVRFATDISKVCSGVGGKLFAYFIKEFSPTVIKSFADRRWAIKGHGNLYEKLGFKFEKYTLPDYRYAMTRSRKLLRMHKFGFRKKILSKKYGLDPSMTETEMAKELNLHRIYDCGLIKYVWKKEN